MEAAYEQGVIHLDLKPANVKVKPDGTVKVLDFGLAKALEPVAQGFSPADEAANSPTMTAAATRAGIIMGTAAYMAPEQAKGRPVDKRADIWAFGVVLYEMLTGRQAFGGTDISETLAFVLTREIDWTAVPPATPASVRRLLRRCVTREHKNRLADMSMARVEIDEAGAPPEPVTAPDVPGPTVAAEPALWQRPAGVAAIALVTAAIAGLAVWALTPAAPRPIARAVVSTAPDGEFLGVSAQHQLAISPDGTHIVYVAGSGMARRLYVRRVDQLEGTAGLGGIDGADTPFFSPDVRAGWCGHRALSAAQRFSVSRPVTLPET